MSNPEHSTTLNDLWTESPDYRRCYQTDHDVETTLARLDLPTARCLVDVGCGNGAFAIAAAERYPACRVYAFDAMESAIGQCRDKAGDLLRSNLAANVAWAHALPLTDACSDRVLCRSVLHHIAKPRVVYEEIARVLTPGGRLVLQAPCNYWEESFADLLSGIMMLLDDSHRRSYYRPAEILAGLDTAGLYAAEAECWTYSFPYLGVTEADLVRRHGAVERLRLRQIAPGKWSIVNYWIRIVARKNVGS